VRGAERAIERAVQAASYAMGLLLLFAILVNFVNVVGRYVFLRPLVWGEEAVRYATIWVVFTGLAVVAWRGLHLRMDVVYELFPTPLKRVLAILIALVTLWLCGEVVVISLRVIGLLQANNQRSPATDIPVALMYYAIPVGFALTGAVAVVHLIGYLTGTRRVEVERTLIEEEIERL
jgi:C4-dicarboxylate transporter DctQ subunit